MSEQLLSADSADFPTIRFRYDVETGDLGLVDEIVASTGFFNRAERAVARELVEERLERGPASGYHFVFCAIGEATAGYACYGPIAGTRDSYDLFWIAVHRTFQRRGLGRAILDDVERRIAAAGGSRIYVETSSRDQYAPTRAFYENHGYRLEATLPDFYAPGDGKLVYVKVVRAG